MHIVDYLEAQKDFDDASMSGARFCDECIASETCDNPKFFIEVQKDGDENAAERCVLQSQMEDDIKEAVAFAESIQFLEIGYSLKLIYYFEGADSDELADISRHVRNLCENQ